MGLKQKKMIRKLGAAVLSAVMVSTSLPFVTMQANALVTDPAGEYDNFAKALQYSLHFFDANMCGPEVEDNSRFKWRANCHVYDQYVPLKAMDMDTGLMERDGTNLSEAFIKANYDILNTGTKDGTVDVSGGYHDAGDHVKFGLPEAYAGTTVSWGYYEFKDAYVECEQQEHVETIIRHFCDYFMRCTFRDKNGDVVAFCYQVGDGDVDHKYWQLPQNDTMVRTAWFATPDNPTTCAVTNTAACLAINYLNFKESDPEYADKCLDYAKALYDFANKNDKATADTDQGGKGYYGSNKWEDDYSFASCWLYLITEDKQYIDNMLPVYDFYATPSYVYCWNDMWHGVGLLMARISDTYKSEKTYSETENPLGQTDLAMDYITVAKKSPYEKINFWGECAKAYDGYMKGQVGKITPQGYFWLNTWGSCRYNTAVQFCMLVYDKYTKGKDLYTEDNHKPFADYYFTEWAKGQMEYILGKNDITYLETGSVISEDEDGKQQFDTTGASHGPRCFLTGFDENSAAYPHHRASSGLTKCEDPDKQLYVLFGALCGGPDANDGHNDVTKDWIYNEVTIDYNAACPGAAAGLYLSYKDTLGDKQKITPDFPPEDDGGRGASSDGGEGGGKGTWVEACGIDDIKADGAGVTKISLMVKSNEAKPPQKMTVRYYFDCSEISNFSLVKSSQLYDQVATEAAPNKATLSDPKKWEKDSKYGYVEIDWGDYNFANCGKKYQFSLGLYYGDKWDQTNDPSYKDLKIYTVDDAFFATGSEVRTDNICVYADGVLIGGIEPDGTVPETNEPKEDKTTESSDKPAKKKLRGDADENGTVTVTDAVLLACVVAESEDADITDQGKINADCNDDGVTDRTDLTRLLRHLAQIEPFED